MLITWITTRLSGITPVHCIAWRKSCGWMFFGPGSWRARFAWRNTTAYWSMSERIGIPLAYGLDRKVKHVVILPPPISPAKLTMMKLLQYWKALGRLAGIEPGPKRISCGATECGKKSGWGCCTALSTPSFFRMAGVLASDGQDDCVFSLGVTNRDYPTLINALRELPEIPCHISSTSAWVAADKGLDANVHCRPTFI